MKKIVIDARLYGLKHAGIGRYITNLLKAIKVLKKDYQFQLLVSQKDLAVVKKELGDFYQYYPLKSAHYSLKEQWEIKQFLEQIKPDLVHFPHFNLPLLYSGKYVVTIHDLIKHFFKGRATTTKRPLVYWPKYLAYRLLVKRAVMKARAVIVPTFWWQEKLADFYKIKKSQIFVTHEGVDEFFLKKGDRFLTAERKLLKKYGLTNKDFLIYTGSVYPHKNIARLIKALKQIDKKEVFLAVVCARSVFSKRLEQMAKRLKMDSRVKFLGFVPDQELVVLYQQALALVQPSLMEGFGLTGLEAMACGCPVVSSNTTCLPEVYGKAVLYFDPLDEREIKKAILKILNNPISRKKLIDLGRKQAAKFSWAKTAEKTIKVYQKALN